MVFISVHLPFKYSALLSACTVIKRCVLVFDVRSSKLKTGEAVPLTAGDWLKVAPAARRRFSAAADTGLTYICIQTGENSLGGFTTEDVIWC